MVNPKNEYIIEIVATNVRIERKCKGLTIVQLAEKVNVEKVTISRIERGLANPTISTMYLIALALEVKLADLFEKK
jgi:transcriptional regulator with XRE-family HTH domain